MGLLRLIHDQRLVDQLSVLTVERGGGIQNDARQC
jgi:hypothetical protein